MSKLRKIILISLFNITILLWLTFIYSVLTHEEDSELLAILNSKENSKKAPEKEIIKTDQK